MVHLRRLITFFGVYVLLTPSFKDYLDYYYNFDIPVDASIEIIVFCGVLGMTIIYSLFLEDKEMKTLVRVALACYIINTGFNILLVRQVTFGLTTFQFVTLQTLFFDVTYQALLYLPAFVVI